MKIGIEISPLFLQKKAGIAWYSYNLIKNLLKIDKKNTYIIFSSSIKKYKEKKNLLKEFNSENLKIYLKFFPNRIYNYFFQTFIPPELFFGKFDIIHTLYPFSPVKFHSKYIITIHDLIPLINQDWFYFQSLQKFKRIIKRAIKRADKIICNSISTKNDIIKFFNISEEKLSVIYLAPDEIYKPIDNEERVNQIKQIYGITKKYLLSVGTIEPRKNHLRLLNVFETIKQKFPEYQLVIAGQIGWKTEKFFEKLNKLPKKIKKDIIITGYIPLQHLPLLYNGCEIFIYPSLYEGFGLPIVEAMACGCPVITSNTSSLPEIGGDACLYVDPYNVEEMVETLEKVLKDDSLRVNMKTKGLERAKLFSWEKTARETIKVYEAIF